MDIRATFTYTIQETDAHGDPLPAGRQEDGMTYDRDPVTVKVTVTDNGKGMLVPEEKYPDGEVVFENTYTPTPTTYTPAVKKILSGSPVVKDETFEFKIEKTSGPDVGFANETASVTYTKDGQATGEQTVPFGAITFSQKGTYEFKITETTQSGNDKIHYDGASWTFKVVVTDDGKGHLDYEAPVYDSSAPGETETAQAVFRNTYTPVPAEQPLKVTKKADGNERPADAEFKFTLAQKSATPEGGAVLPENTELTVHVGKDQASNAGTFAPITFNAAGTYVFTITEEQTGLRGYVYDTTTSRDVQVTVDDDDGTLKVTEVEYLNSSAEDSAVFTNHYDPENVFYTPKVKKTLTVDSGSSLPEKVDFTFELTQIRTDESPEDGVVAAAGDTPVGTQTVSTPDMTGSDTIEDLSFNELEFTKAGTYYFQITEKADTAGYQGFTYDGTTWTLTVKVNDNGGKLEIPKEGGITYTSSANPPANADQAEFSNSYASAPAVYSPHVKKTIDSIFVPKEKDFTFNITYTGTADGVKMPENTSVTVSGAGEGIFDEIGFTKTGTYTFDISETDGKLPGYGYDEKHWTLTVVVGDSVSGTGDEARGQLVVNSVSYVQSETNTQSGTEAEFTNTYTAAPDSITPQVKKDITGAKYPQDNKKEFTFLLTADEENEAGGASLEADDGALTAKVTGEGPTSFGEITFRKAGIYTFTIRETDGGQYGYTYDETPWKLTVQVDDVDHILTKTSIVYSREDGTEDQEHAVFTNAYDAEAVPFAPAVVKKVTGDVPEGKDQTFTFTMSASEDNAEGARMPEPAAAEVTGSGSVGFGEIIFDQSGVYSFEIREENGGAPGYSYDGNVWTVTVNVEDNNGVLAVGDVVYARAGEIMEGAAAAVFENRYDPAEVSYAPQVVKKITGDETPDDRTFYFSLKADEKNSEGAVIRSDKAKVTGAGSTNFGEITFSKAGVYRFLITEDKGSETGYTYDGSQWTLTVTVTDENGALKVSSAVYAKDGTDSSGTEAAEFINRYEAAKPAAAKTGDGMDAGRSAALMAGSAFLIGVVFCIRRKRRGSNR